MKCWNRMIAVATLMTTAPALSQSDPTYDFAAADATIQRWVDKGYYECATIIVMRNDGTRLHEQNFGKDFDRFTNIRIASMTKWLEAAALMTIVDQGLISLDDKVSKYLPEFTGNKADITLRQCFSHTSGIGSITGYKPEHETDSIADRVSQLVPLDMPDDPGTTFHYDGNALNVAARVVELVTGRPWEIIFAENMAGPARCPARTRG